MSNRWIKRADEMAKYGFGPKAMMAVKVCTHCGRQALATENYCISCSESLNSQTLHMIYQKMHPFCPVCGMVAPDSAFFCPVCGASLDGKHEKLITDKSKAKNAMNS